MGNTRITPLRHTVTRRLSFYFYGQFVARFLCGVLDCLMISLLYTQRYDISIRSFCDTPATMTVTSLTLHLVIR